jgi:hypothetical protein
LQDDLVEAVVGLPTNLFYGTGIPAAILVLNKAKKVELAPLHLAIPELAELAAAASPPAPAPAPA